MQLDKMFNDLK